MLEPNGKNEGDKNWNRKNGKKPSKKGRPEDKEHLNKEQDDQIKTLQEEIVKKEKDLRAMKKALASCRHSKAVKTNGSHRAKDCAYIQNHEADVVEGRAENIQSICGPNLQPKVEFTCEPVSLSSLGPPNPKRFSKDPETIKKSSLPHKNLCLDSQEPPQLDKRQEEVEKAQIDNLRRAYMILKKSGASSACDFVSNSMQGANKKPNSNAAGGYEEQQNMKPQQNKETEKFMNLVTQLQAETAAAKLSTKGGRQGIIERCIALKQREAAVVERSESLCHVRNEQRGTNNLILQLKTAKLARYMEYMRWYLIRLTHEKEAQDAELAKLDHMLGAQRPVLLNSLEIKNRLCAAEREKQKATIGHYMCSKDF